MIRFANLDGGRPPKLLKMIRRVMEREIDLIGSPAPIIRPLQYELNKSITKNGEARLTWLGHSGWLIQLAGKNLLIDPIMKNNLSGVIACQAKFEMSPEKFPPIEATLISHDHYDHLDNNFLKKIKTRVIAGLGMGTVLDKKLNVTELKWWESLTMGDIKITFVPSQHGGRRGVLDRNTRLWGGFIIEAPGISIYHAGDSAYFDGFRRISEKFNIQIAILPIGAYGANGSDKSRIHDHMDPEHAIMSFHDLNAKYFIPMHWGTYQLTDEPLDEPPQRLLAEWHKQKMSSNKLKFFSVGESKIFKF